MSSLTDPGVQELLNAPNYAVVSTHNGDGTILSTVVWVGLDDGKLFVNSALGRRWPANLDKDPNATLVVMNPENAQNFLEVRGTVTSSTEHGTEDINWLAHKYIGQDYPWLGPGEQRVTFVFEPSRVRLVNQ
ncbi:MAG TPA: pyridoxamine 5'-phosphate oxidase family protein [Solirubrobacteraceae bacterium]|jgi:PPOX class probable F420-dependent enzyme|nr:pyridoxamine 5'-phosphate oxidase family protein [Solirubrobacteraceae bacterium]